MNLPATYTATWQMLATQYRKHRPNVVKGSENQGVGFYTCAKTCPDFTSVAEHHCYVSSSPMLFNYQRAKIHHMQFCLYGGQTRQNYL